MKLLATSIDQMLKILMIDSHKWEEECSVKLKHAHCEQEIVAKQAR